MNAHPIDALICSLQRELDALDTSGRATHALVAECARLTWLIEGAALARAATQNECISPECA